MADELKTIDDDLLYDWDHSKMVRIEIYHPDDFLKIKETLTRVGIGNRSSSILTQSCHILHRGGEYYIVHFKELFRLEGRPSDITLTDIARRNTIIGLLEQWNLLKVVDANRIQSKLPVSQVCVVPYSEKSKWLLQSKHRLGRKKNGK